MSDEPWKFFGYTAGTKPNLVAKILPTKFGVFFVICIMFYKKYVQYESNDNVIKYYGLVIPHDWDVSFEKFTHQWM